MVTRKLRAFAVPLALAALTANARTVSATEEWIVHAPRPTLTVEVDKAALRANIERYIRSVNGQLRVALDAALKPASPLPVIRVADDGTVRDRG